MHSGWNVKKRIYTIHLDMMSRIMCKLANKYKDEKDKIKIKALNQCARELLLLQTSDWEFNLTCYRVMEYSYERINAHIERFNKLYEQIEQNTIDEQYLKNIEWKDKILPELDYRDYISNK